MNFYIFAPSITITALSGIASFLSTSQYISDGVQNGFGIGVGIVASISSVLQSLAGACQYSAKTEAHRTVAEQYNNLIISVKFEIEMPNEEDFTDKLEIQILDIQSKCNYFVPQFIVDKYDSKNKQDTQAKQAKQDTQVNKFPKIQNTKQTSEANLLIENNSNDSNDNIVLNIDDKNYNTFGTTTNTNNTIDNDNSTNV